MAERTHTRRGWRRWTEAERRAALKELGRSGMSASAFARSKGFSTQRPRYWKERLQAVDAVSFVAVPFPLAAKLTAPAVWRAHIEITCDDVVVRVREDLDVEHLELCGRVLLTFLAKGPTAGRGTETPKGTSLGDAPLAVELVK